MKRLIICADGTWNVRDQKDANARTRHPSNVTKVARAVKALASGPNAIEQVVYYHDGIGTSGGLDKYTGGGFGEGIEDNIRNLYRFILYNYNDGDELFFFGFSRGAFTVRTLAGFMNLVGLIRKEDDYWIPEAYACYEHGTGPGTSAWDALLKHITFKKCPPIKFIGVWDTVGSLGAPGLIGHVLNGNKYQYHDVNLNDHIENGFQALAIDERRGPFRPDIWTRPANWKGTNLCQAWFPGVHSNVGGGCSPDGLANEALHWIVEMAEKLGLEFEDAFLAHYTPCFNSVLQDSMSITYEIIGTYERVIGEHLSAGECIHQSALDRLEHADSAYKPKNLTQFMAKGQFPICDTVRIERGNPCGPMPAQPS